MSLYHREWPSWPIRILIRPISGVERKLFRYLDIPTLYLILRTHIFIAKHMQYLQSNRASKPKSGTSRCHRDWCNSLLPWVFYSYICGRFPERREVWMASHMRYGITYISFQADQYGLQHMQGPLLQYGRHSGCTCHV